MADHEAQTKDALRLSLQGLIASAFGQFSAEERRIYLDQLVDLIWKRLPKVPDYRVVETDIDTTDLMIEAGKQALSEHSTSYMGHLDLVQDSGAAVQSIWLAMMNMSELTTSAYARAVFLNMIEDGSLTAEYDGDANPDGGPDVLSKTYIIRADSYNFADFIASLGIPIPEYCTDLISVVDIARKEM